MRRAIRPARRHAGREKQQGAVAVMVALSLVLLIGFTGLALDVGKLYIVRSELANAADACALSAARDLTGAVGLTTPEAAGITAGEQNKVLLQSQATSLAVNSNVMFSKTFGGPFQIKTSYTTSDLPQIAYVRCTVTQPGVANWFMSVVFPTLATSTVAATAVASTTQAQTTCALPMYVCKPPSPATVNVYDWLCSKVGSTSPAPCNKISGNFGWIDLGQGNGASANAALFSGPGQCNLPTSTTLTTSPGMQNSVPNAYNTRFGIYAGGQYKGPADGPSDFTGYAYTNTWLSAGNSQQSSFTDFLAERQKFTPYQGDSAANLYTGTSSPPSSSYYTQGADRRLAVIPIVDNCSGLNGNTSVTVSEWACVLLLHPMTTNSNKDPMQGITMIQYLGSASNAGTPCATQGIPGSTSLGIGPKVPVLVQ
ncbi:pilus assembly protein TadG-related protein [Paraburkholderia phosphatilytica]|uniref:pilus assembly protein TadG-related protein n=1 Tax=Paraburkholderia phosphatilytica TaxID=2282883 RepID=UPI000E4EAD5B|nr:pilus assembly protein TadG-related protein [Paraburkholderia phosphatilytica]